MKRNSLILIRCAFVDEKNGINSLYKLYYKRIPLVLDILSNEILITDIYFEEADTISVKIATTPQFRNKFKRSFYDAFNKSITFDMSINGIDVIPYILADLTEKPIANGFKPIENTRFSWSR